LTIFGDHQLAGSLFLLVDIVLVLLVLHALVSEHIWRGKP
jgi:hypothetical protein